MKKRLLATMLCLTMAVAMTACGKSSSDSKETTGSSSTNKGEEVPFPDFSAGLTDDGFIKDITVTDYIKLAEYKGIEVDRSEINVTDEDFESYMKTDLLSTFSEEKKITDRPIQDDDLVNIDYVGKIGGVAFEGGSAQDYTVRIGVTQFIDDFIEQLIGHKIGEKFDIEVTFPDEYSNNPDLAGKDAVFTITINSISEMVYPEITDEFVKKNFEEYETAEKFLKAAREEFEFNAKLNYVWTKVVEETEVIAYPETYMEEYINTQVEYYTYMAYANGATFDSFLAANGMTEAKFKESLENMAKTDIKSILCVQAVCEAEGITATFEGLQKYFGFEDETAAESIYGIYGKGYLCQHVLLQEAAAFVVENSVEK